MLFVSCWRHEREKFPLKTGKNRDKSDSQYLSFQLFDIDLILSRNEATSGDEVT